MNQIIGNFNAGVNIFVTPAFCAYLGIQGNPNEVIILNGEEIKLSYRGMLEINNIVVNTLAVKRDGAGLIVDYTLGTF